MPLLSAIEAGDVQMDPLSVPRFLPPFVRLVRWLLTVTILCRTVIRTLFRISRTLFGCPDPFHFISWALARPPVILFH